MSVAPTAIGQQSNIVRQSLTDQLALIDQNFADPQWCITNNQANTADKAAGILKYNITFNGELNNTELSTAESGWLAAGWTTATVQNDPVKRSDTPDGKTWTLALYYHP
jgi:hypothetical protein